MSEKEGLSLPLVSIVTPSLNQGKFIELTVRSVLGQSYANLEYIIVDGGSTDGTLGIIRRYEGRLKWTSEKDTGQADAVNKGFRMARGEILGWINADDLYCPGAIDEAVQRFTGDPSVMMVYGAAKDIDGEGNVLQEYPTEPFDLDRFPYRCIICQPAAFMRKSLIDYVGYLNADLQCSMDLDLWIRCGLAQKENPGWKFVYVPRLWALNRLHDESKTFVLRQRHIRITADMIKSYYGFLPFNWVYGIEEVSDPQYDGIFRKRPLGFWLLAKVFVKWLWINRTRPDHVLHFIVQCLIAPHKSWKKLRQRASAKQHN